MGQVRKEDEISSELTKILGISQLANGVEEGKGSLSDLSTSAISMNWLKKKGEKLRKPKDAHGGLLTSTTAASVPSLEANTSTPALSDVQHEPLLVGVTTEHSTAPVANTAVDEQPEQTARRETMMRGSRTEKWLSRAALLLNLTKSAADAAGLAPLKGACEGVVTLLDALQVSKNTNKRILLRCTGRQGQ